MLKSKIKKAVDNAFTSLADLVQQGKLSNTKATGYDFTSGSTTSTTSTETIDIIILDTKKLSGEPYEVKAIMKSGPSLDNYDKITVGRLQYHIVEFTDNGYSVDLILKKEA